VFSTLSSSAASLNWRENGFASYQKQKLIREWLLPVARIAPQQASKSIHPSFSRVADKGNRRTMASLTAPARCNRSGLGLVP